MARWFKRTGKRDQIFLATKFGYVKGSKTFETDSSASYCKTCCEESLKRLEIDSIDLCESLVPWTPSSSIFGLPVPLLTKLSLSHRLCPQCQSPDSN